MDTRRYDIDWLRSLAFMILIFYHVGMYYVADWGWHIKSEQQYYWLQDLMLMTNQWRMSLLFFISGVALSLVAEKYSGWYLAGLRSKRLLIPLISGMLVIVPPQLYYELLSGQYFSGDYLSFIGEYWNLDTPLAPHKQSVIGLLTWNHLWFIPYLWVYSLIMLLCYPLLNRLLSMAAIRKTPMWLAVVMVIVALAGIWVQLRAAYPVTHGLIDDWYSHAKYFLVFVVGMSLPKLPHVWQQIIAKRRYFAVLAGLGYSWLMLDQKGYLDVGEALDGLLIIKFIHGVLLATNHWAWIFALLGYAGRYLNFSNGFIKYCNVAILPWYMLHQTLIIIIAANMSTWALPVSLEASLILLLTFAGCYLGYEIAKRFWLLRVLFGLKVAKGESRLKRLQPDAS